MQQHILIYQQIYELLVVHFLKYTHFTNNTGGTFSITGISSQDTYITGGTPNDNLKIYTLLII